MSDFAIVPAEVALDPRLTKMQLRVLIALLTFRAKNTDTVWPKRETLSARCGYHVNSISKVTKELVALGWLVKQGKGGYSKSTEYKITVPDHLTTLTEPVTLTESVTVTEPVSTTLTEPDNKPSPDRLDAKNKPITTHLSILPEWIDHTLWIEFMELRKTLKAKNTDRAISLLISQLTRFRDAGHDPNTIIENSIMNSWKGVFEPKQRGGTHGTSRTDSKPDLDERLKNTGWYEGAVSHA